MSLATTNFLKLVRYLLYYSPFSITNAEDIPVTAIWNRSQYHSNSKVISLLFYEALNFECNTSNRIA